MSSASAVVSPLVKPRLRGIPHAIGALVAVPAVILGVGHAGSARAETAALVYGLSLLFLLSTSAIYHTPQWTPRVRMWLRRIDHTAIFVLIAGSYTPLCLVALPPSEGRLLLALVWAFAGAGALLSLFWPTAPRWVNVTVTVAMGWMVLPFGGALLEALDGVTLTLFITGGVLYSIGGITYARRAPDPLPATFGYHEVFHTFVLVAVACHFIAIWSIVA